MVFPGGLDFCQTLKARNSYDPTKGTGLFHRPAGFLILLLSLGLAGCGAPTPGQGSSGDGTIQAQGWSQPGITATGLDTNTGLAFTPRIAAEPDTANNGGSDDALPSALAVWVEMKDLNPFDNKPAVYHVYASRWNGTAWEAPVLMDTGSADYPAWAPQVAMDNQGNGVVVFEQADGGDCDTVTSGTQTCTHVYGRRYTMGSGWEGSALRVDNPVGTFGAAVSPAVAMERDPGVNNGGIEDTLPGIVATFTQWDGTGWRVYAARTTALTGAWSAPVLISPPGGLNVLSVGRTTVDWESRSTSTTYTGNFSSVVTGPNGRIYASYHHISGGGIGNDSLRFAACDGATLDCTAGDTLAAGNFAGVGTISSSGTTVTGTGTVFTRDLAVNGTISAAGQIRKVTAIASNTSLTTDTAFFPALSAGTAYTFTVSATSGRSNWKTVCVDGFASPNCTSAGTTGSTAGLHTSIAIDRTAGVNPGRLYIAYATNLTARFVSCLPGAGNEYCSSTALSTWSGPLNITAANPIPIYLRLKVDSTGRLHLVYQRTSGSTQLNYINCLPGAGNGYCTSSGWSAALVVDAAANNGQFAALAIDGSGVNPDRLYVTYQDVTNSQLKYATCLPAAGNGFCATSGWTLLGVVGTSATVTQYTGIGVDATGRVHVAFHNPATTRLRYATCLPGAGNSFCTAAAGNWSVTDVDTGPSNGRWASLEVDAANRVHVVYNMAPIGPSGNLTASPAGAIKYATCNPGAGGTDCATASNWNLFLIQDSYEGMSDGSGNSIGTHLSIALDPAFGLGGAYDARSAQKFIRAMGYSEIDNFFTHTAFRLTTGFTSPGGVSAVAMDAAGRATVAMILTPIRNCSRSSPQDSVPGAAGGAGRGSTNGSDGFGGAVTGYAIDCGDDRLFVNRYDFVAPSGWKAARDITPAENLGVQNSLDNTNCEDIGNLNNDNNNAVQGVGTDGDAETMNLASPCVDLSSPSIVMDDNGNALVAFKSFQWVTTTDTTASAAGAENHNLYSNMTSQRVQIFVKTYAVNSTANASFAGDEFGVATAAATTTTLTDLNRNWGNGQWVGGRVTILASPNTNRGLTRTITANTGTSLTFTPALPNATAAGATYVVSAWSENLISQYAITGYADNNLNASTCGTNINNTGGYASLITNTPYVNTVDGNAIMTTDAGGTGDRSNIYIMNCSLDNPVLAVKPNDGSSAMLTYERYGGNEGTTLGRRVVVVHRCIEGTEGGGNTDTVCGSAAGEWGVVGTYAGTLTTVPDSDQCTNALQLATVGNCWGAGTGSGSTVQVDAGGTTNAFSPRIAMDNNGNAMLVWTQKDGPGKWRVYSRRFCANSGGTTSCGAGIGWQADPPVIIDGGGSLDYFEPRIAMEQTNTRPNHTVTECGAGNANCGDAVAVFGRFNSSGSIFRIDAAGWAPP